MLSAMPRWLSVIALAMVGLVPLAIGSEPAMAATSVTLPAGVQDPCPAATSSQVTCAALTIKPSSASSAAATSTTPSGFGASDIRSAYGLPTSGSLGTGGTVAVVTAYDDPDAESDLATYRSEYGIAACTTANGCFKKVGQTGSTTSLPSTFSGWSAGTAQSVDMISAVCPNCDILVVEASSPSISNVGTAENEAVTLGADFIDNDWETPETTLGSSETTYDSEYFDHPGVAITAPAGNTGYGVNYPASSPYVTAVGGTTLVADSSVSRGWTETAWAGSGSGCSAYEPKPSWQTDTGCANRTLNDAAAVADPNTPVAYYDTPTAGGWQGGGGTDISAAIVAADYALAGSPAPGTVPASYLYEHPGALNAVTSGSNGTCSPSYLCTAGSGYNGPAGMGTPSGADAFATMGARPAAIVGTNGTSYVFVHGTDGSIDVDSLASGSSTWSGLSSLGGDFQNYPAAVAGGGGFQWVASVSGGDLEFDDLPTNSTTWAGWNNIGNPGTPLIGIPALVQDTSDNNHVFVRSASGTLYTATLAAGTSTWSSFTSLGGTWPDDVDAFVGGGGTLRVLAVGTTKQLYHDDLESDGSWSGWTSIGGSVTGTPTTIQDQAGSTAGTWRVFVRSAIGTLDTTTQASGTTTWSSLSSLGGSWQYNPVAFASGGGTDWIYAVGNTAYMYYDKLSGGSWSGWTSLGGAFTGVPGATQNSSANEVFGRTTAGALDYANIPNGTSTWSAFSSLGSPIAGS